MQPTSTIVDASGVSPVMGPFRQLDRRSRSNAYDVWDEYLCSRTGGQPSLATCVFEALSEPPDEWFDEDGEPCPDRLLDGQTFPPAFYDGNPVSELGIFVCGALTVSPSGDELLLEAWSEIAVRRALEQLEWRMTDELVAHIMKAASAPARVSELPEPLVSAYLDTSYRVENDGGSFVLRIGATSEHLAELLRNTGCRTATFVTAWNPLGRPLPQAENRQRNRLLRRDLEMISSAVFLGEGAASDRTWPAEPSYLSLGLSFEEAVHVGRHYRQNAIVWADEGSVPILVLLR